MSKPVTPLVACDVFVINQKNEVLLIQRSDNKRWALPGGCNDLGETPLECAIRECREETGYEITVNALLGIYSSKCYEYVYYPWKENEFCHLLFSGIIVGGFQQTSNETLSVAWFSENNLPPLSDGHDERIIFGFKKLKNPKIEVHFE